VLEGGNLALWLRSAAAAVEHKVGKPQASISSSPPGERRSGNPDHFIIQVIEVGDESLVFRIRPVDFNATLSRRSRIRLLKHA
jgi:hypothetical protein